jgi:hypothetical protein
MLLGVAAYQTTLIRTLHGKPKLAGIKRRLRVESPIDFNDPGIYVRNCRISKRIAANTKAQTMLDINLPGIRLGSGSMVEFVGSITGGDGRYTLSSEGRCFIFSGAD